MFMAMFPEFVYGRLDENTRKDIESSSGVRRIVFEKLTVGANVKDTDIYQELAKWLLTVPEKKLKKLTVEDVIDGVGEYLDMGGHLV